MAENTCDRRTGGRLPGILMPLVGIAWVAFAFVLYYRSRPLYLLIRYDLIKGLPWLDDFGSGWSGLPLDVILQGALLVWIAVVAGILGWSVLRRLQDATSELGALVWGSGLVLGMLGMVVFGLGTSGLIRWPVPVFGGLLVVLTVVAFWRLVSERRDLAKRPSIASVRAGLGLGERLILLAIAVLSLLAFLYALTPALQSDALRYHLAAPQEWLKAGHLAYLPYNAFSNFPATVDMLFLFGLGLAGDLLATGFHFLFYPLSIAAVGLLTEELAGRVSSGGPDRTILGIHPGFLAAVVWAASPLVLPLAGWAFVDLGVLLFTLGTIHFLVRWVRGAQTSDWVLSAAFGGLLAGSKYPGVLVVMFGALVMLVFGVAAAVARKEAIIQALLRPLIFGTIAAAIASPWWVRNVIHTGNPVYPLAYSVFDGGEWSKLSADIYAAKLREKGEGRGLRQLVELPWSTATRPQHFGNFEIGPFYWAFAPWVLAWWASSLVRVRSNPARASLALWLLFLLISWFLTYQDSRFLLPFLAVATVASVDALSAICMRALVIRVLSFAAFLLPVVYCGADTVRWLAFNAGRTHWPSYTAGFLSRSDYLALNLNYYRAAEYANSRLGPENKILLVGEHRKFHWECRVEGNDWYDQPRILPFLRESPDVKTLIGRLEAAGFTHVFFNLAEWGWPEDSGVLSGASPIPRGSAWFYNNRYFSREDLAKLQDLLKSPQLHAVLTLQPGRIYLSEIRKEPKN